jgi:methylenetetrahydrofolate dehydrogenase (NADP+)/methenyltetrahydrofolate cyclohydrolase
MAEILDGKLISSKIKDEVKESVLKINSKGDSVSLAVIIVGEDPASKIYVRNKKRACEYTGINSINIELPSDTSEKELLDRIDELNRDERINGILVQLPLPEHIDKEKVINKISPIKDVDGFNPFNIGRLSANKPDFVPCTPAGIIELLKRYNIEIDGKNCVVIGRSDIVGKPVFNLLLNENGTVTVCHTHTKNLKEITLAADIIISAVGKRHVVTKDMVRKGEIIIDVGMNREPDGKLYGDCDYDELYDEAAYITPVPGGVGPMTIAMLMKNCLKAYELQKAGLHEMS